MSSLKGVRVIRGPDWKWEDQDGGIGNVGTVIDTPETELKRFGPRTVTVVWDSGYKGQYRAGPKGCYDLRIVDNTSTGVKHTNIPCDGDGCVKEEICGILWQCATCLINLCTSCFMKEIPHDKSHHKFFRRDGHKITDQKILWNCWSDAGPESRIPLLGIYPGAKVVKRTYCSEAQREAKKIGTVSQDEENENIVLVKWYPSEEKSRHNRFDDNGIVALRAVELGIGGYLDPNAFPPLEINLVTDKTNQLEAHKAAFSIGDWVKVDPAIQVEELRMKQADHGGYKQEMEKLIGVAGRVESLTDSSISVRFNRPRLLLSFNPMVLKKLNELSMNQTIRIKDNKIVIEEIRTKFGELKKDTDFEHQLKEAVGRVIEILPEDPLKVYIQFDKDEIHNWLPKNTPLPSSWLEKFETNHSDLEAELVEAIIKNEALFFKAVDREDLRIAKLLYSRYGVPIRKFYDKSRDYLEPLS